MIQRTVHVLGVPQHDHVDDQPECAELVLLALSVLLAQLALLTEEDGSTHSVAALAPVELGQDAAWIGPAWIMVRPVWLLFETRPSSLGP